VEERGKYLGFTTVKGGVKKKKDRSPSL